LAASVEAMARMQDGDGTAVERIAAALEALVGRQATSARPETREPAAGPSGEGSGRAGTNETEPAAADDENEEEEKEVEDVGMKGTEGEDGEKLGSGESEVD
jgi:hypothetical protein